MDREPIVAVGLLTQREVRLLGPAFDRAWPVEEFYATDETGDAPAFAELLEAIDRADEALATGDRETK